MMEEGRGSEYGCPGGMVNFFPQKHGLGGWERISDCSTLTSRMVEIWTPSSIQKDLQTTNSSNSNLYIKKCAYKILCNKLRNAFLKSDFKKTPKLTAGVWIFSKGPGMMDPTNQPSPPLSDVEISRSRRWGCGGCGLQRETPWRWRWGRSEVFGAAAWGDFFPSPQNYRGSVLKYKKGEFRGSLKKVMSRWGFIVFICFLSGGKTHIANPEFCTRCTLAGKPTWQAETSLFPRGNTSKVWWRNRIVGGTWTMNEHDILKHCQMKQKSSQRCYCVRGQRILW